MTDLTELQATTDILWGDRVTDTIFKNDPYTKMLLEKCRKPYSGGRKIQEEIAYNKTIGGAIDGSETVNVDIIDVTTGSQFEMKLYEDNVSELLRTIHGYNRGAAAKVNILDTKLEIAAKTLSERIAIAIHRHGQATGTGVADARAKHINGWAEFLNDGVSYSWDGNYFPTVGGLTRNGNIGSAMNSVPFFCGDTTSGAAGQISYSRLLDITALPKTQGGLATMGFTSINGYNLMLEKWQTAQRLTESEDPVIGFSGFSAGGAKFFASPYFPSSANGVNDPNTGSYLPSDITIAVTTPATASRQPASGTIKVGEVGVVIDPSTWDFYVSDDPVFGFGNTGWKVGNNHLIVSNQFLAEVQLVCRQPRHNVQFFGFNS